MIALYMLLRDRLSIVGVSVAGAVTHNATQIAAAFLLVGHVALFNYLPYLTLIAVPTGLFVGFCSRRVTDSLEGLSLAVK
jgi:heptaprenyl diphosphate synthase